MKIVDYIKNNILILDGAMGTLLQGRGLAGNQRPETLNLTDPALIKEIHLSYFDAGSHVVNTNTFGANSLNFDHDELEKIISAALKIAGEARDESRTPHPKFIALDIGPLGRLLKPLGSLDFEAAVSIFAETVKLGTRYGADLIMIETMSDSYETKAALLAAKENSDLPVFVSNAFGEDGKLMTGASAAVMVAMLEGMGADAIGVNCSFGPDMLAPVVRDYLKYASVPVLMKANAGLPREENGTVMYDVGPDEFAAVTSELISEGVRIAGGCCGTTPEYIRTLTDNVKKVAVQPIIPKKDTCIASYSNAVFFGEDPLLIGERINPTGKKRFKQALIDREIDYILSEGIRQQESGVHILDVNVGIPQIDEAELLETVVSELQAVVNLPLEIDTASPAAMERALRRYNGKALINSVNGRAESMSSVFPLMRKYGGVAVALTLDEKGIPESAEGRVAIAERILRTAEQYGIDKKNLIFDTLTMAVSADGSAARVTLDALKAVKKRLDVHTLLGVSNVSFGLPDRSAVGSAFFLAALENGLSAAIMNPFSPDMMKAYYSYRVLNGLDKNCADYIRYVLLHTTAETAISSQTPTSAVTSSDSLCYAIQQGRKEAAARNTVVLLSEKEPMSVISDEIIPALDTVGSEYEAGRLFLPQLLMSAEAAQAAFEQIKKALPSVTGAAKCSIVLATVQGDIHDIGKNIVKLLLQNYGFDVHDLGRDVSPEKVADAVVQYRAPLAGLSALMTTTVPAMEKTVRLLHERAPWCHVVVGGAVLTAEYAVSIGADRYARDAMETVRYAEEINQLRKKEKGKG